MFTAVMIITAPNWKKSKCSSTEWANRVSYVKGKLTPVTKDSLTMYTTEMNLGCYTKSSVSPFSEGVSY